MAIDATTKITKKRSVPSGELYFNKSVSGVLQGERYLGLTPGFTWTVTGTKIQSYGAEEGVRQLDDSTLASVDRTGQITCRQIDTANLSLFLIADSSTVTQTATPVTDEAIAVTAGYYYQLGASTANPTGVRGVSSLTFQRRNGEDAAAWAADTVTTLGTYVHPVTPNTYFYKCTARTGDFKTHSTTEPNPWPTTAGATIVDDAVTWTCMGLIVASQTTGGTVGYVTVDADLGRFLAEATAPFEAGEYLEIDYTPTANSRTRIAASALAEVTGTLRYVSKPMKGDAIDLYAPNVTLSPTGDAIFKADDPAYMELTWEVEFAAGSNGEAAIYLDGRPA